MGIQLGNREGILLGYLGGKRPEGLARSAGSLLEAFGRTGLDFGGFEADLGTTA